MREIYQVCEVSYFSRNSMGYFEKAPIGTYKSYEIALSKVQEFIDFDKNIDKNTVYCIEKIFTQ